MPIKSRDDAVEVESRIARIFAAPASERAAAVRALFVEALDFDAAVGHLDLGAVPGSVALPASAERVASLEGVQVVLIALDTTETERVRKGEATAAAKRIADQLGDDLLLVFTNSSASQLHFVYPSFQGARPILRRMVVERDLPRRTAVQQVSNIYWNLRERGAIRLALDHAFDVEPVTKEFFAEYKRVFQAAENSVSGFGEDVETKRRFVQTLFNRLMFIYFLSRKGWLTFKGDKDYLNALWRDYQNTEGEYKNFYIDRLRLLYFAGLNNYESLDYTAEPEAHRLIGDVPFLNGGLFDMTDLDARTNIVVPDECISEVFTELFDHFNFTVMESTPFDEEVAVDPEMLGKVFEELVTGRHDSGAYYTPRPVVSFMCREALKGYLEGQDTGVTPKAIARFVDERDTSGISSVASARKVAGALDEVTVVDPACGSGAYLLGMMQELVELQTVLFNVGVDQKGIYDLKLHIIERNLYGVDIDDFAVNIAMLRMWLSLAIEYEGDVPQPLPNLEFKILCGDSLLGPDPGASVEVQGALGYDAERVQRLGRLKADFMRASLGSDKERMRREIQEAEVGIREALGAAGLRGNAVDWRVEFAEVFAQRRGFDVAIANPPYVQLQGNQGLLADQYKDVGYKTFPRTGDVYQLFYERGCQALKPANGLLAYITSNSWLKAEYGKTTRRYFSERHTPLRLLELGKDVFESAIVDSGVLALRTGGAGEVFPGVDMDRLAIKEVPPEESLWGRVRPDGDAPWSILSPLEQSVLDKMRVKGTPLGEWDIHINRGITTGYNGAFIVDDKTKNALVAEDPRSTEIIKPILRGRDIRRYRARWAGLWLIYSYAGIDIDEYPATKSYLLPHEEALRRRTGGARRDRNGNLFVPYEWYELQVDYYRSGAYREFTGEKLLWMDMSPEARFAYSDADTFCNDKGFILTGLSLKFLCAVLNSQLTTWFVKHTGLTTGMGLIQWKRFVVERIPVPQLDAAQQAPFIDLVDRILAAKDADPAADTSPLEWEIDRLVYDLYGMMEEEDTAVERSLGLIHQTDEEEDAALSRAIAEGLAEMRSTGEEGNLEELRGILRGWDGA